MSFQANESGRGFVVGAGGGAAIELPGWSLRIKVPGADTGGRLTVLEGTMSPGHAGPLEHLHRGHEEAFFILEGSLRFRLGDAIRRVVPGETVFASRGVAHGFSNPGSEPARYIAMLSPSGFEVYFARLAALIHAHGAPPDRETWVRLMAEYETFPAPAGADALG